MEADVIPLPKRRRDAEILSQVGNLLDQVQSDAVRDELQKGWERAVSQLIYEKWLCEGSEGAWPSEQASQVEP